MTLLFLRRRDGDLCVSSHDLKQYGINTCEIHPLVLIFSSYLIKKYIRFKMIKPSILADRLLPLMFLFDGFEYQLSGCCSTAEAERYMGKKRKRENKGQLLPIGNDPVHHAEKYPTPLAVYSGKHGSIAEHYRMYVGYDTRNGKWLMIHGLDDVCTKHAKNSRTIQLVYHVGSWSLYGISGIGRGNIRVFGVR
ncbi:unnamed protein product [Brassica oleracea var. botrytis]